MSREIINSARPEGCQNPTCFGDKVLLKSGTPVCIETLEKFQLLHGKGRMLTSWFPLKNNGCSCKVQIDKMNAEHKES